jgi:hypothetical protein
VIVAVCVALSLLLAPAVPVATAPAAGLQPVVAPAAAPELGATARAEALFDEGKRHFDLADYDEAIRLWTAAAVLVPDAWIRAQITYTIAGAHVRAYAIDRDPGHLRRAQRLFERFLVDVQRLDHGKDSLSTDVADATVEIERIGHELAELDRRIAVDRELMQQFAAYTLRAPLSPGTRALRGVGIAATSAGVVALGSMAAGLVLGRRYEEQVGIPELPEGERIVAITRGERANILAIAGAVLGAGLLAIGIPTLVVGEVRARRERDEARQRQHDRLEPRERPRRRISQVLLPVAAPGRLGLVWEGRF